jgi:hypothetical protein
MVSVIDAASKGDCEIGGGSVVTSCQYDADLPGPNRWTPLVGPTAGATGFDTLVDGTVVNRTGLRVGSGSQLRPIATGVIEATEQKYTPATAADWPGATWLPTGQVAQALDELASWGRYYLGLYDQVVDVTGDADACATIQRLAIHPVLSGPAKTYRVWVRGTQRNVASLKEYANHRACIVFAASSAYDANGYPDEAAFQILSDRKVYLDTYGLDIGVTQSGQTKTTVVFQAGGTPSSWFSEFLGVVSTVLHMRGHPTFSCDGTAPAGWEDSRLNSMSGSGRLFSGGQWASTSCIGLLESNHKRADWTDFHPHLTSSKANKANVGWVAVNSWIVDRGRFSVTGFHTAAQVFGNVIGSVTIRAEGVGFGLVCGDRHGNRCWGLHVRGAQLEGARFSELVATNPTDVTIDGVHIESEGVFSSSDPHHKAAHVLIGAGFGEAADGYRPCYRDEDLPSGGSCSCAVPEADRRIEIRFVGSTLPGDRGFKSFELGNYSNRSSFATCASQGNNTVAFSGGESATSKKFDDAYYGTDRMLVEMTGNLLDQPDVGDTVTCATATAEVVGYGALPAGVALGPCTVMSDTYKNNRLSSSVSFTASDPGYTSMADAEDRDARTTSVLFVSHPDAAIPVVFESTAIPASQGPPVRYPRSLVSGSMLPAWETLRVPIGACDGTAVVGSNFSSATGIGPTRTCSSGAYNSVPMLSFPDGATRYAKVVVPWPNEIAAYNTETVDAVLYWKSEESSGEARLGVFLDCVGPGDALDRANGNLYAQNVAPSATPGRLVRTVLTQAGVGNGCSDGELFYLGVVRYGGDGADTLAGSAEVVAVEIAYPRWAR